MHEESLFVAALDRPASDRPAFLDDACGADAALRGRVERLLAADQRDTGILDAALDTKTRAAQGPPCQPLAAGGEFAGRFRLVRRLGAGGMGEVWEATQIAPVRRSVALKVLHPGLDPAALLTRFEFERQALAVMDHPHIARVFDAGVADGLPYLAMELVPGELVTAYCDARRLTVRRRLELFVPICRAVQHAHQKGVIHRDLKPSNVLVAEVDGKPAPKVIDFGIAKAAVSDLATDTARTGHGAVLGTPEYMAPEQAGGAPDVDTRADVYALGVLLYELLTGSPPIRAGGHGAAGMLDLLRAVREDEPPAPSRRVESVADRAALAAERSTDPPRLQTSLRGDLDWVVMKALAKDRGRRYGTAAGLAQDVERFLAGEPVTARPVSRTERLGRWVRRNPRVAGLLAVVGVLLLTVAVGATVFAVRVRKALDESEKARGQLADAQRDTRRQLWQAQLSRALATTQSGQPGQRSESLAQLREALAAARELGLTEADRNAFRDVAIAALALPELEVVREWDGHPPGTKHLAADARFERYARADQTGAVSVRRVADDQEVYRVPGPGRPTRVALSGDGRLLAVASDVGSGRVYRLDGPEPELLYATDMDPGRTPHFTPDGGRLVYTAKGSVRAWDRDTGRLHSWPLPGKPRGGSALSADGRVLAVGCERSGKAVVHVRSVAGPEMGRDLPAPAAAEGLAWHPRGRILAVYASRRIRLLDVQDGTQVGDLDGHRTDGGRVAFDAVGDRLFSNDWSGVLRVWDWRAGRQILALPSFFPTHEQLGLADGHLFVHGTTQSRLRILRTTPGRERRLLGRPDPDWPDALADPGGRFVLLARPSGTTAVDPETGEERSQPMRSVRPFHLTPAGDLLTSGPDGPLFWSRADDPSARVTRFGPPEWIGPPGAGAADTHGASSDGRVVAVPNHWRGAVVLHRDPPGVPAPTGPQDYVRTCAVSPSGRWVATGSHDCPSGVGARVWDARTGALVRSFPVPGMCPVGFSPDGRWLVTAGGGLRLWRVGTWDEGPPVPDAAAAVGWAFAPSGDVLAVGGHGSVRLVRPIDGAVLARLPLPGSGKFHVRCFAPDGSRLYVADLETGGLVVWDVRLVRQGLAELDLDWDTPPLPPPAPPSVPWQVEFTGTDRLGRQWDTTEKAAWANPTDADVRTRLAALADDPRAAVGHATLALVLNPARADARYYRARANLRLWQYAAAAADAAAVLQAMPGHRDATRIRDEAIAALRLAPPPRPVRR